MAGVNQQYGYKPDIMLMTGAFGTGSDPDGYSDGLSALAQQQGAGFMDMRSAWSNYMAAAAVQGWPQNEFYRDDTHANEFGKQFLGRALASQLTPDPLAITAVQLTGTTVKMTWSSDVGANYSLWIAPQPGNTGWMVATNATATTNTMSVTVDTTGQGQAFYRVSTQ